MNGALCVGLTGGIGSGKSTVSRYFSELGVPIIDADEIAHAAIRKGGPGYDAAVSLAGRETLDSHGEIRRDLLRSRVFADDDLRNRLEAIIHPLVYKEMRRIAGNLDAPYCIVVIPLLVERGGREMLDRVLVVDAPEAMQLQRSAARDRTSEENIAAIMRRQASRQERLQAADDVIHNDADMDHLRQQVAALHSNYERIAAGPIATRA